MAVKVIKHKEWDETPRQVVCDGCGCTLEYVERDIKHGAAYMSSLYQGTQFTRQYITCAHCSHDIDLNPQHRFGRAYFGQQPQGPYHA